MPPAHRRTLHWVDEEALPGGVANAGAVVRVGEHVLRPSNPHSSSILRYLAALRATGFEGAPTPVDIDPDGRERLVYIPGDVPVPPFAAWAQSDDALATVARLVRRFHEASRQVDTAEMTWSHEMADPRGGSLVCHNDVCLENVVFHEGRAVALLDFDFAAPGRPLVDVASLARMCVPVDDEDSASRLGWTAADRPARLRIVADAYGLEDAERVALVEVLGQSIERGGAFVRRRVEEGDPNFLRMWRDMGGEERDARRSRWWEEHRHRFLRALV